MGLGPTKNFSTKLHGHVAIRAKEGVEGGCVLVTFYTQLLPVAVMRLNFPDNIHRVPVLCFVSPSH